VSGGDSAGPLRKRILIIGVVLVVLAAPWGQHTMWQPALVFPSARGGGYLTLGQARCEFQKATAAVDGRAGVRLHDLRHT
jgi:integrase